MAETINITSTTRVESVQNSDVTAMMVVRGNFQDAKINIYVSDNGTDWVNIHVKPGPEAFHFSLPVGWYFAGSADSNHTGIDVDISVA